MKIALTVLCAARSGQSWHENMLKDFDCAIYGLRVALESPHTGQPQEGGAMSDIQNQLRIAARESGRKSAFEEAARIAENFESDGNPFPTIQGAIAEAIRAGATLPAPQAGCAKEGDDRVSFPRWWIQHLYTGLNRINTASVPGEAGDFIFTLRHQLLDKLSETAPPVLVADKRTE